VCQYPSLFGQHRYSHTIMSDASHFQYLKFRTLYQQADTNENKLDVIKGFLESFVKDDNGWDVVGEDRPAYVYPVGYAIRLACDLVSSPVELGHILNNYVLLYPDWLVMGALWFSGNEVCLKTLNCFVNQAPDAQFRLVAKRFVSKPMNRDDSFTPIPMTSYGKEPDQRRHNTIARWFILGEQQALEDMFNLYLGNECRHLLQNPGALVGHDLVVAANKLAKAPDMLWFIRDAEVDPVVKQKVRDWLSE
jgi:hypothetical protein